VRKPEGKRPLVRPRPRWKDIIKMVGGGGAWTGLFWLKIGTGGGHL
jgi:hypothetical protein